MTTFLPHSCVYALLAAPLLTSSWVYAQALPDAGSVRQQIEGGQRLPIPALQAPAAGAPAVVVEPVGPSVTLKTIRFEGNTVLDGVQLAAITAPWLARPLGFAELEQAARAVTEAYRQAGYLARAEFGRQDLTDGVATLHILEARFGRVRIEGERLARLSPERLEKMLAAIQTPGDLVRTPALDRALLLIGDLPGVVVRGQFEPGAREGETDIVLKTTNSPLLSGKVLADNAGGRSIGAVRQYISLELASPLGLGDKGSLALLHSRGSDYVRTDYSVPVGYTGLQVGLAASQLRYRLVSPELQALNASGNSRSVELQANYPLLRSQITNLYTGLTLANKHYFNEASGFSSSDYPVRSASLALWGNRLDSLWGGGYNTGSLTWTQGHLNLNGSPSRDADAAGPQVAGSFGVARIQASRQQTLMPGTNLNLRYSGQWANKNLDSSEKFYLGGASGVRAYPQGEASGSMGQLINVDLQTYLGNNLRLSAFIDWGQVTINHTTFDTSLNRHDLSGYGLALDVFGMRSVQMQVVWARRLGSNPSPLANGNDLDGSLQKNRFWLNISSIF